MAQLLIAQTFLCIVYLNSGSSFWVSVFLSWFLFPCLFQLAHYGSSFMWNSFYGRTGKTDLQLGGSSINSNLTSLSVTVQNLAKAMIVLLLMKLITHIGESRSPSDHACYLNMLWDTAVKLVAHLLK